MKQVMKRKIKRIKATAEVDFEVSHKPDTSLIERVDAVLQSIDRTPNKSLR